MIARLQDFKITKLNTVILKLWKRKFIECALAQTRTAIRSLGNSRSIHLNYESEQCTLRQH
jgi:hypothetical protein